MESPFPNWSLFAPHSSRSSVVCVAIAAQLREIGRQDLIDQSTLVVVPRSPARLSFFFVLRPLMADDNCPSAFEDLPQHISYVPQGRGSGLQVRIWRDGERYQKFFALSHFATPGDCLFAAKAWRDLTLSELPGAHAAREHGEDTRRKISEKMTRTGVRGLGFQVGKKGDQFRMYATVQWRKDDQNRSRMRSLHAHGIDGAARQLARVLVDKVKAHADTDPAALADRCAAALRRLISRIYEAGTYPSSRHGHEEERYDVLAAFVEKHDDLPVSPAEPAS